MAERLGAKAGVPDVSSKSVPNVCGSWCGWKRATASSCDTR